MTQRVQKADSSVFVLKDFADLGGLDQVGRVLRYEVKDGALGKLGKGVYAKLRINKITGKPTLVASFGSVAREALSKLEIPWRETLTVSEYNAGRTTQIQANTVLAAPKRRRPALSYGELQVKYVDN